MSFLEQEIAEQPDVLRRLLGREQQSVADLARAIQRRHIRHVIMAARGSSDNAATYGKYLLGACCGLPVASAAPSLYTLYQRPPRMEGALVIGISQSGRSPDIVGVLSEGRSQGALTAAITNDADSPLARACEHVIQCHAGVERSVAATKTYTAQVTALAMLGAILADDTTMRSELDALPAQVEAVLSMEPNVLAIAPRYRYMQACIVVARGYNHATALEIALKLKELTYMLAEPYSSADFMHGPLAVIEHGFPALVIAPRGVIFQHMMDFAEELRARGAEIILLSDDEDALASAHSSLRTPTHVPEWLTPITMVIPGQLLALHLTLAKGYDPDHPRGLSKITETV